MLKKNKTFFILFAAAFLLSAACGDDKGVVKPGEDTSMEHWWDNYLNDNGEPIELPSGFKLVPLNIDYFFEASPVTTSKHTVLNFTIDVLYRSNLGYIFRGDDQNNSSLENLAGAVEFYKEGGWLKKRETFDWEGLREDPVGSFEFVRINRFTQFPIRTTFAGVATDLMVVLLSEPYIANPTDTTKVWYGDPVHVSQGTGSEFTEIMQYSISYLGQRSLVEDGTNILGTFEDVIQIKGRANQGQGKIDAYLAPNIGLIYYYYITAFGQKAAGALLGYAGANFDIEGNQLMDYFPTAGSNHWIYEFAPDDGVDQFRFSIQE